MIRSHSQQKSNMWKKLFSILFLLILTGIPSACTLNRQEINFVKEFPDVQFNQIKLANLSLDQNGATYFNEQIWIVTENETREPYVIADAENICTMIYDPQAQQWVDIDIEDLQIKSGSHSSFPLEIQPNEEVDIWLRPSLPITNGAKSIRIILTSTLPSQEQIGGYLDIKLSPFPGLNFEALSLKSQWPELQAKAENWIKDAYLASIFIHIPQKKEPNGHLVALTFQSSEDNFHETVLQIDKNGRISEQFNTYSKGVVKGQQIRPDQWSMDASEIIQRLLAYDPSIEIPSDSCDGVELSYLGTGELAWTYSTSDCAERIEEKYRIDPVTGDITLAN